MNAINTITLLVLMVMLTITIITTVHYARQAHDLDCELEACTTTIGQWFNWSEEALTQIGDLQTDLAAERDQSAALLALIHRMTTYNVTPEDLSFLNEVRVAFDHPSLWEDAPF